MILYCFFTHPNTLHILRVLSPNLVFCTCNWGNKNIGDTKSPRMMEAEKVRNSKSLAKCIYQGTRILKGLGKQMEFQWSWDWSDLSATLALCLKKGNIYVILVSSIRTEHNVPSPSFKSCDITLCSYWITLM